MTLVTLRARCCLSIVSCRRFASGLVNWRMSFTSLGQPRLYFQIKKVFILFRMATSHIWRGKYMACDSSAFQWYNLIALISFPLLWLKYLENLASLTVERNDFTVSGFLEKTSCIGEGKRLSSTL